MSNSTLAASAPSTPVIDGLPPLAPPRAFSLPPMQTQRLPNGLELLLVRREGLPLVHAALLLRAGPERDPAGLPGVAQATAALLTKGARRAGRAVPASELARQAESLGGLLESRSSWGQSSLSITVSTPRLPAALALISDAWCRPLLLADEAERLRAQTLDAIQLSFSDPGELGRLLLRRAWWGDAPYGAVATPATVQRLGLPALRAFHSRWYRPEHCALLLVGDVQADAAQALALGLLGGWEPAAAGGAAARQAAVEPAQVPTQMAGQVPGQVPAQPRPRAPALVLLDLPGSGQSNVLVAAPHVGLHDPARTIGAVANAVLGVGYSARLNQEVRIRRGLSYGAGSGAELQPGSGLVVASAQTQHASAAQVLQILREQLASVAQRPPSADELSGRQAVLVGGFGRQAETLAGLAGLVGNQWLQQRPVADLAGFAERVQAVTAQQVAGFAARHWRPEGLRAVVVGDLAAAEAAGQPLPPAGPEVLRLKRDTLDLERPGLVRG